jgi:vacuolar-type H+-ATPase subunit I/STV1
MLSYSEWFKNTTDATNLNEMAISRKKASEVISALGDEIFEHLIKLLFYKDEENYLKHLNDIDTWLFKIDRIELKGNKRPKFNDYYNWLYKDFNSSSRQLNKSIKKLDKSYGSLEKIRTETELFHVLEEVYNELCSDLEKDEFNSIKEYISRR